MDQEPVNGRAVIIVGTAGEARRWATRNDRNPGELTVADRSRRLIGRAGADTHLVVMPSYWTMPDFFVRRIEVAMLIDEGATVQWEA